MKPSTIFSLGCIVGALVVLVVDCTTTSTAPPDMTMMSVSDAAASPADVATLPPDLTTAVDACAPLTCSGAGATCGLLMDGCGGLLNCGKCVPPLSCRSGNQCS